MDQSESIAHPRARNLILPVVVVCSVLLPTLAIASRSAGPNRNFPASSIDWHGGFGTRPGNAKRIYCLMGVGFLRAPTSKDFSRFVSSWLRAHPRARAIEASELDSKAANPARRMQMVWIWIVDGSANLNVDLVRHGCCPAGTMAPPELTMMKVPIAKYRALRKKVVAAELAARNEEVGIWGTESYLQQRHLAAAERLLGQREYVAALREYGAASKHGKLDASDWINVGKCDENLGRYDDAMHAYGTAIQRGQSWDAYIAKARCIWRYKGFDAAVKWLESLVAAKPKDRDYYQILGEFYYQARRNDKAVAVLRYEVKVICANHGFHFGRNHRLVLDKAIVKEANNELAELDSPLSYLMYMEQELGHDDRALVYATMQISVSQQLNRFSGYETPVEIKAGDFDARILRARIYMKRGDLSRAGAELKYAKVLADESANAGEARDVERTTRRLARLKHVK